MDRGKRYTGNEKQNLLHLVQEYKGVIQNKKTDAQNCRSSVVYITIDQLKRTTSETTAVHPENKNIPTSEMKQIYGLLLLLLAAHDCLACNMVLTGFKRITSELGPVHPENKNIHTSEMKIYGFLFLLFLAHGCLACNKQIARNTDLIDRLYGANDRANGQKVLAHVFALTLSKEL
ncbi:hypothetical protein ILUMI_03916 [Ignelater luminosus]|uniref:Uncharacterized protein n=1 Tax=Ignelater luminosus TaxID=2038154 RepID=A0A8K0GLQ1_IGNLU|nr:hypothetical protein ILUMI_03916 [Ignelater luminosus]